jgi:hypothetical protein
MTQIAGRGDDLSPAEYEEAPEAEIGDARCSMRSLEKVRRCALMRSRVCRQ